MFMDKDFLLNTETARGSTTGSPPRVRSSTITATSTPREIWEDRRFENITQVWLGGDHYKWRLMVAAGDFEGIAAKSLAATNLYKSIRG